MQKSASTLEKTAGGRIRQRYRVSVPPRFDDALRAVVNLPADHILAREITAAGFNHRYMGHVISWLMTGNKQEALLTLVDNTTV